VRESLNIFPRILNELLYELFSDLARLEHGYTRKENSIVRDDQAIDYCVQRNVHYVLGFANGHADDRVMLPGGMSDHAAADYS